MEPAVINRKTLFWTGEHWINFLRRPGEEAHSGMVSLYHTHYSTAGAGIVALVHVDAPQRFTAICTDNRALVPFIQEHWPRGRIPPFDGPDVPVLDATFRRGGDIRRDPGWIITVEGHEIVARWMVTQPPLVMTRAGAGQMTRQDNQMRTWTCTPRCSSPTRPRSRSTGSRRPDCPTSRRTGHRCWARLVARACSPSRRR